MNRTLQPNEWRLKELVEHFDKKETREIWDELCTIDPLGM